MIRLPKRKEMYKGFIPPPTGNAPEKVKRIVKKTYSGCRSSSIKRDPKLRESKKNKELCARVSWSVAKTKTGYKPKKK